MAYNIGVANFAHTCEGQSYGVHPQVPIITAMIIDKG